MDTPETWSNGASRSPRDCCPERSPVPADLAAVTAAGPHAYLVLRPGPADAARTRRTPFPVVFQNSAATVVELPRPVRDQPAP